MAQYKVVEQKAKSFLKGVMKAQDLEDLINQYANEGWDLDRIVAGETASFVTGSKDVFLIIFKRN